MNGFAGGVAVAGLLSLVACTNGTAATPSSGRSTTAGRAAGARDVCGSTAGKYGGAVVKSRRVIGTEDGKDYPGGGTLQVWRSVRCGTVWARLVKDPANTRVAAEGGVGIYYPTYLDPKIEKRTHATTRWNMESPAVSLPRHARFQAQGGYLGKYLYESLVTVHL